MDLSTYQSQILDTLGDPAGSRFPPALLEQALRQALMEYSIAFPLNINIVHTVTTAGREQAIPSVTAYSNVRWVIFPYDPITGFDEKRAEFCITQYNGTSLELIFGDKTMEPQVGQAIGVMYTTHHTIEGFDGAESTTINPIHELLIVDGAAGLAATYRAASIVEVYGKREEDYDKLRIIGEKARISYLGNLLHLSTSAGSCAALPMRGWAY